MSVETPIESHEALPEVPAKTPAADEPSTVPTIIIEPPRGWISLNLPELWRYRDLLALLIWRDLAARYRQSVIGYGWAVIKPIMSMLIFTFIFGRVARIPSDGSPYPLFAFTALLPWMYFSNALTASTNSVVGSSALLTKVYFPRLILPVSSVIVGLAELSIQFAVLVGLIVFFHASADPASNTPPDSRGPQAASIATPDVPSEEAPPQPRSWRFQFGWNTLCAPLFVLLCTLSALSVGLWLTALNVKYRDVGQAVPFLTQAWMWLSPIIYSSSAVPEHLRPIYGLNPMVGVIEGFRWSILGTTTPDWSMMAVSVTVVAALLVGGLYYFRRTETTFADII